MLIGRPILLPSGHLGIGRGRELTSDPRDTAGVRQASALASSKDRVGGAEGFACGIASAGADATAVRSLLDGIGRVKYRGRDSAGIATLANGRTDRRRAKERLDNLDALIHRRPIAGTRRLNAYGGVVLDHDRDGLSLEPLALPMFRDRKNADGGGVSCVEPLPGPQED